MTKSIIFLSDVLKGFPRMMSKEEIVKILQEGICEVTFNKVNGERRVMPCTLKEDLLPVVPDKEQTYRSLKAKDNDVVSVWCTDKNAWRSFKMINFISINPLYENK